MPARKKYSAEDRQKALDLFAENGGDAKRVAEELDIPIRTVQHWCEGKRTKAEQHKPKPKQTRIVGFSLLLERALPKILNQALGQLKTATAAQAGSLLRDVFAVWKDLKGMGHLDEVTEDAFDWSLLTDADRATIERILLESVKRAEESTNPPSEAPVLEVCDVDVAEVPNGVAPSSSVPISGQSGLGGDQTADGLPSSETRQE